jgi:hypothetical protein
MGGQQRISAHQRAIDRRSRSNSLFSYPCPIEKAGTTGGTNRGTRRVHLSMYPSSAPTADYGRVFPRQFAPPLVGRAARLRPPSRALDTHSTRSRAGQRPRSLACPIGQRLARTRLSAEVGQHAWTTSHHRAHPRQVVGPQDSTCSRIGAHANAAFDPHDLARRLPFPFTHATYNATSPTIGRRNDEPAAGPHFPPLHPARPHAAARLSRASGLSSPRVGRE